MLKIALINPKKTKKHIASAAPPINLGILASYLRKQVGSQIEIRIIDGLAGQNIEAELLKWQPELIGITSTTPTVLEAYRLVDWIKNNLKSLVVMGGVHASVLPEEALKHVDIVIVGEGELAFLEIAQKSIAHESMKDKIIARPYLTNLDEIPSPAWDLMDLEFYIAADDNTAKTIPYTSAVSRAITLISSRGCPYHCIFCHNSWLPTPVRYHSAERVIEELNFLNSKYGINSFFFADDEFLVNRDRLNKICQMLIDTGLNEKITWGCQARSDVIERMGVEGLKLIKQAGCNLIAIGFESGSQRVLDILEKSLKLKSHQNALLICQEASLKVSGSFMFGTPGETKEDMLETVTFINSNRKRMDLAGIGIATPYPGTKLWRICEERGLFNKEIKYDDLCPDPRFGLREDRIFCDTMTKKEFIEFFRSTQDQMRENNLSRSLNAGRYAPSALIKLFSSHPLYVIKYFFKYPKKSISLFSRFFKKLSE